MARGSQAARGELGSRFQRALWPGPGDCNCLQTLRQTKMDLKYHSVNDLPRLSWGVVVTEGVSSADVFHGAGCAGLHVHMNLGILYYGRGETVDAVTQFEQVLEILEGRPPQVFGASEAEARFRLAQAHVRLGHHAEAIEHLRVAEERGGKGKWGRKSREYLAVLR